MRGILSPHHMYIDTCTSYTSTLYAHLFTNVKKQARGLMGHSNTGLCSMSSSGEMGALKKVWLNKGGMATILPLKGLEKMWHIVYGSRMQVTLSSRTTTKACLTLTSRSLRLKRRSLLCRLHEGTWKALPSVKWRKCGGLARCKECGGIPPTATFWEWYVAA